MALIHNPQMEKTVMRYRVYGEPAPQGSKNAYVRGNRAILVESSTKVRPWRAAVIAEIQSQPIFQFTESVGVMVTITFHMKRPKSHYGTKKGVPYVKETSPVHVKIRPDIDKLCRSTLDAITDSGLWWDDSQVSVLHVQKIYDEQPGATIEIEAVMP